MNKTVIKQGRNFFGNYSVDTHIGIRRLVHGNTSHGKQFIDFRLRDIPLEYYHYNSPIGNAFSHLQFKCEKGVPSRNVAILGLGVGQTLAYGDYNQNFDLFEINPAIIEIAKNRKYFTYLRNTKANYKIYQGDARIEMKRHIRDNTYDLILADTFISDNIPTHLITKEAIELYLQKLKPDGVLVLHISSRFINLEPMLTKLVALIGGGVTAIVRDDKTGGVLDIYSSSYCVLIAKQDADLSYFDNLGWRKPQTNDFVKPWTDDYSNIIFSLF